MKKLQKGFSLVELLVVVAIIGVLAGVGIVGYQSYTESAKSRVAIANFNSVKRFVETELTLLNNNIQTVSGALQQGSACSSTSKYTVHSANMTNFLTGLSCYFATDGYGNAFKNPFDAGGGNQIAYNETVAANKKKGLINIRMATDNEAIGGTTVTALTDASGTSGFFVVEYFTAQGATGTESEYQGKIFELK